MYRKKGIEKAGYIREGAAKGKGKYSREEQHHKGNRGLGPSHLPQKNLGQRIGREKGGGGGDLCGRQLGGTGSVKRG